MRSCAYDSVAQSRPSGSDCRFAACTGLRQNVSSNQSICRPTMQASGAVTAMPASQYPDAYCVAPPLKTNLAESGAVRPQA